MFYIAVVLHRPPSGKPKLPSNASNVRNRRLRMPLPPENNEDIRDAAKAKMGVPVSCPSPPTLIPRSRSPFDGERIRPQSANPVPSTVKISIPDIPKKSEKVFFSPVVEIMNPLATKVSAFKVNHLKLDLEKDLSNQSLPENPLVKKSLGESSIAFGRHISNSSSLMEKFLENSPRPKPSTCKPKRPSSATTYSQNIGLHVNSENVSITSCKQRPASASATIIRKNSITENNTEFGKENVLEPFVFGFKSNKVMCGSESDLASMSTAEEFTPYKISEPPAEVAVDKEPETTSIIHQCDR
jgi:hypothetical protein